MQHRKILLTLTTSVLFGLLLGFTIAAVLTLTGCASSSGTTTPATPTSPSQTVLNYVQAGATADDTAAHVLLALCTVQPGQTAQTLSPQACSDYKGYLVLFPPVFDAIGAEAASTDPWATQRIKIAEIAASATVSATITNPTIKAQIASLTGILNQILGVQ
jgi:hypothetical protein